MSALEQARNSALQKVGRNLVSFQKVEAILKHVLAYSDIKAPASKLPAALADAIEGVSRMSIGKMAEPLVNTLFAQTPTSTAANAADNEINVTHTYRLEGGEEASRNLLRDLKFISSERNALAHTMLVAFNPDSIESCERLSVELDAQRQRVLPVLEWVRALAIALRQAQQETAAELMDRLAKIT